MERWQSWDEWISTYNPETARLAEEALTLERLPQNFQYAVPKRWHDEHPNHGPVVWVYRGLSILTGEPFDLTSAQSGTDL